MFSLILIGANFLILAKIFKLDYSAQHNKFMNNFLEEEGYILLTLAFCNRVYRNLH